MKVVKVKKHTRTGKNKVTVVRNHSRQKRTGSTGLNRSSTNNGVRNLLTFGGLFRKKKQVTHSHTAPATIPHSKPKQKIPTATPKKPIVKKPVDPKYNPSQFSTNKLKKKDSPSMTSGAKNFLFNSQAEANRRRGKVGMKPKYVKGKSLIKK